MVLTSLREAASRGAERVRHDAKIGLEALGRRDIRADRGIQRVDRSPGQRVDRGPRQRGQIVARDQPDRALLVQRDQVGHDLLPLELEHVVDVREVRQKLLVNVLVVARDQALYLRDESEAVHGAGIQVGKRSSGELRLQRTQHGSDRRYCRVLTMVSLRDQPGQRRPGKCCRQQPAIF